jgi:hypothetical protein
MASSSSSSTSLLPSEPEPWRPSTSPPLPLGALLDIADDLWFDILTEYMHNRDVCAMDAALCQRQRRPAFLALLSTKVLLFNREETKILDQVQKHKTMGAASLRWIDKRGIHLASLFLPVPGSVSDDEERSIHTSIVSLAYNGCLDKIETFRLGSGADAELCTVLSKCSVKSIDIEGCELTHSAATHIKHCAELEAFSPQGNESAAEMADIVQSCKKLRKLEFDGFGSEHTDEVLQSVATHCPLLAHLNLYDCGTVSGVQPSGQWLNRVRSYNI